MIEKHRENLQKIRKALDRITVCGADNLNYLLASMQILDAMLMEVTSNADVQADDEQK